jgi:hypothetical protein
MMVLLSVRGNRHRGHRGASASQDSYLAGQPSSSAFALDFGNFSWNLLVGSNADGDLQISGNALSLALPSLAKLGSVSLVLTIPETPEKGASS